MYEPLIIKLFGAVVTGIVLGVMGWWAKKLTNQLDSQLVINAQTSGALALIIEKLNGHERMDEVRFDHLSERLGNVERDVAHRAQRA